MAANGNAPIVSAENCTLLDSCQRVVDQLWRECGAEIAGDKGYKACQLLSATNSHPEFPIFATAVGSLPSLANGHSHMCVCIARVGCLARVSCRIYQCHTTSIAACVIVRSDSQLITMLCLRDVYDTTVPMRGLTVNLWGDGDPVTMCVFNCNYSQTRTGSCMVHCCLCREFHTHQSRYIFAVYMYMTPTCRDCSPLTHSLDICILYVYDNRTGNRDW